MTIPGDLAVLLERMFARKIGTELVSPPYEDRVDLYLRALKYVEQDLSLFAYVLGHRREVSPLGDCKVIDDVLLECVCRDPRIIPKDFRERLPRGSSITPMLERLYVALRTYHRFDYEEYLDVSEVYTLAAE